MNPIFKRGYSKAYQGSFDLIILMTSGWWILGSDH